MGGLSREAVPRRVEMDPVGNGRGNDRRVGGYKSMTAREKWQLDTEEQK